MKTNEKGEAQANFRALPEQIKKMNDFAKSLKIERKDLIIEAVEAFMAPRLGELTGREKAFVYRCVELYRSDPVNATRLLDVIRDMTRLKELTDE